jgi:alpha-amylase/alpha-mannosidase (GH57 family)
MDRYICIHGHFYQPPRENPWLEAIELQDSAYPYHDWNERITAECYAPNAASRILDVQGRIVRIVNNYSSISYNVGPTLLAWLEEHAIDTYRAIIDADAQSQQRFGGHGSALAQPYNHMIMPLATPADRTTQMAWGLRDYRRRFQREPEGMWLPETAVDIPTLELLADHGIKFTVLAPHQAARIRRIESNDWHTVDETSIDTTRPYVQRLRSGKSIAIFFYNTTVSRAVAFEGLLKNGEIFAQRLLSIFGNRGGPQLGHIATDGETYGHHHRHGDMALAYATYHIESKGLARLTNYGQYLEMFPPEHEVEIHEMTSWSCAHGVERWRSDCGCNTGGRAGSTQAWRKPLREALDWVRDQIREPYEARASELLHNPWAARDDYVDVILGNHSPDVVDGFLERHARGPLAPEQQTRALKLLELQRHAMLMYTSCGWFFHDLAGIETIQVLRYAGRALQLAREALGRDLEEGFLRRVDEAISNDPAEGTGRVIYERYVRAAAVDLEKVAAHYAVSSLYEQPIPEEEVYSYRVTSERREKLVSGDAQMVLGRAHVFSNVTRESATTAYALLYFGDHHVHGGYRTSGLPDAYESLVKDLRTPFLDRDFPTVIRRIDGHFPKNTFSFKSLFSDTQRRILDKILESTLTEAETAYRELYRHHAPLMRFMSDLGLPLPEAFKTTAEYVLNTDLRRTLTRDRLDMQRVRDLLQEVQSAKVDLDIKGVAFAMERSMERVARQLLAQPDDETLLGMLEALATTARALSFDVDVWQVQNIYFDLMKQHYPRFRELAADGDARATQWVGSFTRLGEQLAISVDQGAA